MPSYHYQQGDRPLDGYTIQYAIGRGGFGEVYFAVSDAGREVALKAVQNFEDIEMRGIGHCMNLKSPHLVMIFDVKRGADGTPWVIMEYVSGPSLRELLDESPTGLGTEQAMYFIRELTRGVGYLHDAGVVHRDLKPHNVFFEDGVVKVGDYSLSKAITNSHRSGHTMTVGSVHYMAPEISMGRYDKTVDIYALGIMLYEMLTGEPPFVGESVGEVLMKHLSSEPDLSKIPEPFAAVIQKAMNRDPSERYQTAQEMYDAFDVEKSESKDDSIPASLSLVGKRDRRAASETDSEPEALHETFSSPAAFRDTVSKVNAEPPDDEESRPRFTHKFVARVFLSLGATGILLTTATLLENDYLPREEKLLALVAATWAGSMFCVAPLVFIFSKWKGIASAILAKPAMLVPLAICHEAWSESARHLTVSDEIVGNFFSAIAASILLFDWRLFVRRDRDHRIALPYTLLVGLIAGIAFITMSQRVDIVILTVATAISLSLVAQLVSFDLLSTKRSPKEFESESNKRESSPPPVSLQVANEDAKSPVQIEEPA